ncbi:MAG: N-acetylmuramoyl-L-alanine amidase [Candidatus Eisenbacteria bacterium]|nr:N-acetylmuramoyl-L-alanine amidase [Candidatus Eisenbacteria bacterium]
MRRTLAAVMAFALAALLGAAPGARASALLHGARIGVAPERTRLVLELSESLPNYRSQSILDTALVLTLPATRRPAETSLPDPAGRIARLLWTESMQDAVLRISLSRPSSARIFVLAADGELPARLVVDLSDLASPTPSGRPVAAPSPTPVVPHPPSAGRRVIVIDPGHGGEDPGAVGGDLKEKDVAFDVASRMAAVLGADSRLKVILTREDDTRVPLRRRFRIAEEAGADLFVSIHLNASPNRTASGAEVYFLSIGAATDEGAKEAARLENEVDPEFVVEEDADLGKLPFSLSLRQSDTLRRSSSLAEIVLNLLADRALAEARGVRQAGFAVLKSYQIPSILVEIGFISSEKDRDRLGDAAYRQRLAEALGDGVQRYLADFAPKKTGP